jgi:lipopolysaccharide biosynthesis protein
MTTARVRAIALYLPQYHPIPENDAWWEPGFTEWTNATKARPMFRDHYQPHLPADLGFYDLRVPETRAAQAAMAQAYGIEAFCYYHYWFAGKRLIERPFEEVVASGAPDFPFCVCWANDSWTGVWHGAPNRLLVEQTYPGREDHERHFNALLPAFRDRRYVRVDEKPVFMIYKPEQIPDTIRTLEFWRTMARDAGLPGLHLVAEHPDPQWDPATLGFDAAIAIRLPPKRRLWRPWSEPIPKILGKIQDLRRRPTIHDYAAVMAKSPFVHRPGIERYPCVIPNWDNTPRSGFRGLAIHGSTPERFRVVLRQAIDASRPLPSGRRFLFIKSWNEWAEGNHLEPDRRFGHQYLEVLHEELRRSEGASAT